MMKRKRIFNEFPEPLSSPWRVDQLKELRRELNDRDLRERCLREAINVGCGRNWETGDYVKAATQFAAYIAGARPAKRKK